MGRAPVRELIVEARRCSLTFDNGPAPGVTERVLDTLADFEVTATFFVCGQQLERPGARALAERAVAEGHRVGNHTWSHTVEFGLVDDVSAPEREIGRTQTLLGSLADPDKLFRPSGGGGHIGPNLLSGDAVRFLKAGAYTCVLWNCVPRDWERPVDWVDVALDQVAKWGWSVVVLHDLATGAMDRLPDFLVALRDGKVSLETEFPDDCVPLRRGVETQPLDAIVGR